MTNQIRRVQSAFSRQAPGFGGSGLSLGREELLRWVVESLTLTLETRALDVAAGTGHLSRAVAPHVRSVTAVDVTPAMLHAARAEAAAAGLANLRPVQADAGRLPFADRHFDLVMCRLALHHFADPAVELAEMARVTRVSGTLAVVDLLSPDDAELAGRYNTFERMRDPSHTRAVTAGEVRDLLRAAGRPVDNWSARDVEVDVDPWFDLTLRTVIDIDLPTSRRRSLSFAAWHAWDAARLFPSVSLRRHPPDEPSPWPSSASSRAGRLPGCGRARGKAGSRSSRRGRSHRPARATARREHERPRGGVCAHWPPSPGRPSTSGGSMAPRVFWNIASWV